MKISLISPGSSPLPPAKCTSVEIYLGQIAKRLARRHDVRCYAMGRSRANGKSRLTISGWQRATSGHSYLEHVTADLPRHAHTVVQIDNRPAYAAPVRKALGPAVPLVLNLHSITFIAPEMIRADRLQQSFQSVDKIVVNIGLGEAVSNARAIDAAVAYQAANAHSSASWTVSYSIWRSL